jgi:hypothetical protein
LALKQSPNIYPIYQDVSNNWTAADEQEKEHIIAEHTANPSSDHWFNAHFEMKS